MLKEYVCVNNDVIINITETWLKEEDQDVGIPNYTIFRGDRKGGKTKGGGVAIYLRDGFESKVILEDYVGSCEIVAVHIEKIDIINIVVYRPPNTKLPVFTAIMNKIKKLLSEMATPEPTVIITGDFNFPFIEWKRSGVGACSWTMKQGTYGTEDEKSQFYKLMEIMDKYHIVQAIEEPTRKENTLDLVFTNAIDIFKQIDVSQTILSDHDLIEIITDMDWGEGGMDRGCGLGDLDEDDLRRLNFHSEKIPWTTIGLILDKFDWEAMFEGRNVEECTHIFLEIIKTICLEIIPRKNKINRSKIPRERKTLLNRIKMLKRNKHRANCMKKKRKIEESIIETEKALSKNRKQERYINEKRVINNMKDNPKVLFDYIRKQNDKDIKIGPFKIGEEYIEDTKELCKILVEQYNSQYSRSRNTEKISNEEINNIKEGDLIEIVFSEDDIVIAINKLNKNSAAGPDGIPSIFLINTKESIKIPLKIILRKSIDEGVVPDVFKMAYVAPVYKGGSKLNPANFRPVSLTSHVMKVFERVLKVQLVGHLVKNDLLKNNQHGFIAGRSTQTQLLQHYTDVFEAVSEGVRLDTVYLDFAKAFDKVNHDILQRKITDHGIKGKVGMWIKDFLNNRKYRVMANGVMSDEQDVISGVPQGTVLASIFFIIMISDIDKNLKNSIVRLFADDTRVSSKIRSKEDMKLLQSDLEAIYGWAEENLEFNENKFEKLSHGKTDGVEEGIYKTRTGKEIKSKKTVKDLGVWTGEDASFEEHIEYLVQSSKVRTGMLLTKFNTREPDLMIKMFNSYVRSKLEYCSLVWNPWKKEEIDKIERVQKNFTSKIEGMEKLNYHQRLKKLRMYSMERRRERYLIINAWQQIEKEKENILKLETGNNGGPEEGIMGRRRCIKSRAIPTALSGGDRTMVHNSTARQMERLFNALPYKLQTVSGVKTETFKRRLDEWLSTIPDTPRIDDYGASVGVSTNSLVDQGRSRRN